MKESLYPSCEGHEAYRGTCSDCADTLRKEYLAAEARVKELEQAAYGVFDWINTKSMADDHPLRRLWQALSSRVSDKE